MNDGRSPTPGYESEADQLDAAISAFESGEGEHVAVLSEPGGGRDHLLEYAEAESDEITERIQLSSPIEAQPLVDRPVSEVFLIGNCHHLYSRKIGGFDVLDDFLQAVARFDGLVVSSWNVFSWEYLEPFKGLGQTFPIQIRLSGLDREQIATLVTSEHDGELPEYVEAEASERESLVTWTERSLELWGGRAITVPFPNLNRDGTRRRLTTDRDADTEELVFEEITRLSNGNPGIARLIWQESIQEGRIELGELGESAELDIDYDTGFLLQIVLAKEEVTVAELAEVVEHPHLYRTLGQLSHDGVLTVKDGNVVLNPTAVKPVVEKLERRRILW